MARDADPERLFIAQRMGLAGCLTSHGRLSAAPADRWINA
jgi:hypothetical protein